MKEPIYRIIFGKDPEFLEYDAWPDKYENTISFKQEYVVGEFATDDVDLFWTTMMNLRENPPAMWYWVIDARTNETLISGAIDYEDPKTLAETIGAPDWVFAKLNK